MGFVIEYCHEKINFQWDSFVCEINGVLFQTTAWANYEYQYYGWNSVRFFVKNEETMVAGCQITIINDDLMGNIGVIRSGPCFRIKTHELISLVVDEMKKSIQLLNLFYLKVIPDYNEHDLIAILKNEKFESELPNLPPYKIQKTHEYTLFLDLNRSDDDLLQQMTTMRRRGIKKGMKSPYKMKLGDKDDLNSFFELYNFTARRHKCINPVTHQLMDWYPTLESYDEVCKIWDELSPHGWVKLFLGTVEDEPVCGSLAFTFGKTFRYSKWGWNLKYPEFHISEAIQWEMIQWAKTNGFQYYDFCEIDYDIAEAYRSSDEIPDDLKARMFYGPTIFKLHFGGNITQRSGIYVLYSDKMKHLMETSSNELGLLLKHSKDFYWAKKFFSRVRQEPAMFNK